MTRHRRQVWTYLPDGEYVFTEYFKMGAARSYGRMVEKLRTEGYINKRTGKPPTQMAVWFRMWRWGLKHENFSKAHAIFNECMRDEGEYYDTKEFKAYLDDKALTIFGTHPDILEEYQSGEY